MINLIEKTKKQNFPNSMDFSVDVDNLSLNVSASIEEALLAGVVFDAVENSQNLKLSKMLESVTTKKDFFLFVVANALDYFHSLEEIGVVNVVSSSSGNIENIIIVPNNQTKKTAH